MLCGQVLLDGMVGTEPHAASSHFPGVCHRPARCLGPGAGQTASFCSPPHVPARPSAPTAPTLQELGAQGEETVVGDAMGLRGPEGMCSPNRAKNRLFLRATSSLETEVNSSALCHISMRVCVCQWPWVSTSLQEPRSTTPRGSARTPQLSTVIFLQACPGDRSRERQVGKTGPDLGCPAAPAGDLGHRGPLVRVTGRVWRRGRMPGSAARWRARGRCPRVGAAVLTTAESRARGALT